MFNENLYLDGVLSILILFCIRTLYIKIDNEIFNTNKVESTIFLLWDLVLLSNLLF